LLNGFVCLSYILPVYRTTMSIRNKILLILLLLALSSHMVITSVYYFYSQSLIKNQSIHHLDTMANVQQHRLFSFIKNNKEKLSLIQSRTQLRRSLKHYEDHQDASSLALMKKIIQDALHQTQSIENIFILKNNGKVLLSATGRLELLELTEHRLFIEGKEKMTASLLMNESERQHPKIIFSAPLSLNNQLLGVIAMEVRMNDLNDYLRDYTGLGETGEVFLATMTPQNNLLIFTPLRFEPYPLVLNPEDNAAYPIRMALKKHEQIHTDVLDYRGNPVIVVSRYLAELNLGIVVKMDKDEILSMSYELKILILYLILFLVLIVVATSLFLANKITRPVIDITDVAIMISRGDFEKRIHQYSSDELGKLAQALNEMADKLINSNLLLEEKVKKKTIDLQHANQRLEKISQMDALTGIKNRGYFDKQLEIEWRRNLRHQNEMVLLLIDVDHFKTVNDNKGHLEGDEYLRQVTEVFTQLIQRAGDVIARFGGEEFAIILNNTSCEAAIFMAEGIRERVRALELANEHSSVCPFLTVSIGLSWLIPQSEQSPLLLIEEADKALYDAKNSGRNRVVVRKKY